MKPSPLPRLAIWVIIGFIIVALLVARVGRSYRWLRASLPVFIAIVAEQGKKLYPGCHQPRQCLELFRLQAGLSKDAGTSGRQGPDTWPSSACATEVRDRLT